MSLTKIVILVIITASSYYSQPKKFHDNLNHPSDKTSGFGTSLPCNLNAHCDVFTPFNYLIPAIFKIENYGTGYLINNLLNDGRLLGITKLHDFPGDLDPGDTTTLTFIFNYEFPDCNNQTLEPPGITITTLVKILASDDRSDRVLFEMQTPAGGFPANINFQLLGWDINPDIDADDTLFMFGHPSGDVKKGAVLTVIYVGNGVTFANISQGALEYGISGSPVINVSGRIIGDIGGGELNGCGNDPEATAIINNIAEEWDDILPFLDPNSTGQNICNAKTVPLPVELISFSGSIYGNKIELVWKTATEVRNLGFDVERNDEFKTGWTKIGFVRGHGTSSSPYSYSFTDIPDKANKYYYRLKQTDINGQFSFSSQIEVSQATPSNFSLEQNYPNPFNPTTEIDYSIPAKCFVSINVYDILGRHITSLINEVKEPGIYNYVFNAGRLNSGTYIYKMQAGSFIQTNKMVLIK